MKKLFSILGLGLFTFVGAQAEASPWVLERGDLAIFGRFDLGMANSEYLDAGGDKPFSLNGNFRSTAFEVSTRMGVFEGFELQIDIPVKLLSYTADPVILVPTEDPDGFDYYQENIIDLNQSVLGVGDIRIAGRWQMFRSSLVGALEVRVKTPTGYDPPAGTFGRNPRDTADFLANLGTYVRPENVTDDVSLGDGQLDLGGSVLLGWALPTRTFLRLDLGGDLRLGGAGDRLVGALKVGQFLNDRILVVAGGGAEVAVQKGNVIGVSVAAEDPTLPASEYGGLNNLVLREVRLDRDAFTLSGGVIFRVADGVETTVEYSRIVHGRNIAAIQNLSIGFGFRVPVD